MQTFITSDSGAVTVDWVVLTAALVGLGLAAIGVVSSGVEDLSGDTRNEMTNHVIYTSFNSAKYSAYYEALRDVAAVSHEGWFVDDAGTPRSFDAHFESKIAEFKALSDEDLVASIQQKEASATTWQARIEAYGTVDRSDLNAVAAVNGEDPAALQTHVDDHYDGDLSAWVDHQTAHEAQKLAREEARKSIADERGLTY